MTVEIDPVEFEDKTGQDLDHAGSGDIWEFLHQMNPSYSNNLMWSIEEEAPPTSSDNLSSYSFTP